MIVATLTEQPSLLKSAALLPPRLSLGSTLVFHGLSKLKKEGVEKTAPMFEQLGFKPGKPWVIALGITEVVSGVSALLGVATRLTALAVLTTQAIAIGKVHGPKGFDNLKGGYEFNLALVGTALTLLLRGPGTFSVHSALETHAKRRELRRFKFLSRQRSRSRLLDLLG
ncbi:DoxX family protein [Stigmatella aurantiaca]|uniref:DoxD-like family protein n=1 Tax=Stigmatella aurantiaca (strain DW4/3-1) TaxID=378806 RepID=Q08VE2_STIAD|nr:DoxX family protein [Stigmatella aurantiaca]ADO70876.1 DoxD-like family protein [Stigmatella aurantiaca DW4/3-1]EAU64462.1 DoxX subfamily, putative [Stigmatella aurantiaca DW4/3-1]